MGREEIKQAIEDVIKSLEKDYQHTQGMILTEDDLMALIFQRLSNTLPKLTYSEVTEDHHVRGTMLHTELSWYDKDGKLTIKPDITILDTQYLSILHKNDEKVNLPSKGMSFSGDAILMELKFIKNKTGIRQATIEGILKKDIEKIARLFKRLEDQQSSYKVFCYFIVFNKTDIACKEFFAFQNAINSHQSGKYKMLYASGKVKFPSIR